MIISVLRTIFLYLFIVIVFRIMGKRQISDLQTSELVITLILSDIAAIPMENSAIPMINGLIPMLALVVMEIVFSVIMLKSQTFRTAVCGKPVIIIEKGKLSQRAMKKLRMSTEDLFAQLRMQEVFHLEDIDYCIAETNGQLSILLKSEKQPLTAGDMKKNNGNSIEAVVVNDGVFLENSMSICGINQSTVEDYVKKSGVKLNDIFIMTATNTGKYKIIRKEKE